MVGFHVGTISCYMDESSYLHPVLDTPLTELAGVSPDFVRMSAHFGFDCIRQMTDRGWGELMRMDGFDYGWFNELVRFLNGHGLLDLLEKG